MSYFVFLKVYGIDRCDENVTRIKKMECTLLLCWNGSDHKRRGVAQVANRHDPNFRRTEVIG